MAIPEEDVNALWDEHLGSVPGGVDWSHAATGELVEPGMGEADVSVVGPDLDGA